LSPCVKPRNSFLGVDLIASTLTARVHNLKKEFNSYVQALEVTTEPTKKPLIITNVISSFAIPVKTPSSSKVTIGSVWVPLVPVPLRNVSNNCYFNAAVQSITYMPEIHELLSLHDVCGVNDCIACRLKCHLAGTSKSDQEGSLYKLMIKHFETTVHGFVEGDRMDSAECFHEIVSLLAAKCPEQTLKDTFEIETSLPGGHIKKDFVADVACTIDSIKNFLDGEMCFKLPKIITIHANRVDGYKTNVDGICEPVVNNTRIDVSRQFNLTDVTGNMADYDLNSFIVYTEVFGIPHYLSYVKTMDGKWYKCDDTNIEQIQAVDKEAKQASVFFYRKRS